uniref:Anoctamin n=1 Tax=Panagrolaimus superbus TaxID=310955 RepID=A0A914YAH1_9BILA
MQWLQRWHLKVLQTKKTRRKRECEQRKRDLCGDDGEGETKKLHFGITLYEQDLALSANYEQFLFDEYLEMVLQFGFVTLFVAALPLAPLFALINNILEIRLDAYKMLVTTRKPIPAHGKNIGIWRTILEIMSTLAVLCNGNDARIYKFFPFFFDARPLDGTIKHGNYSNMTYCRYRDFRKSPCSLNFTDHRSLTDGGQCDDEYTYANEYWIIMSFRLCFVLGFILIVMSIKSIFAYLIPDIPSRVKIQLQRERYLARQAILQRNDKTPAASPKSTTTKPNPEEEETKAEILDGDGPDPRRNDLKPNLPAHKAAAFEPPTLFDHIDADSSTDMKEKVMKTSSSSRQQKPTSHSRASQTTTFPVTPNTSATTKYLAEKVNTK